MKLGLLAGGNQRASFDFSELHQQTASSRVSRQDRYGKTK